MKNKMKDTWSYDIAGGKVGLTITTLINTLADKPGTVKCVYTLGEDPMLSYPDLHQVEKGLKK